VALSEHSRVKPRRNILTMWVSFGKELSFAQRMGFALFSLCLLPCGILFLMSALDSGRGGKVVGRVDMGDSRNVPNES
jgi:hypothetical protein